MDPVPGMASVCAITLCGSIFAGVVQFVAENFVFLVLRALEGPGVVERFNPEGRMQESFKVRNFLAASVSHSPLFLILSLHRQRIWDTAEWSPPSPSHVWTLCVVLMVLHDAWFFLSHTFLHRHKGLYRALHAPHHRVTADLGPFSTSDAEPWEFMIDWAGFYTAAVPLYLYLTPLSSKWSPIALALALVPCGLVNVLGHCGYRIPLWLGGLMSFGVLLIPGAQTPETHFIHHMDPRFNRSLYFTWCDRAAGSFLATHPSVEKRKHVE